MKYILLLLSLFATLDIVAQAIEDKETDNIKVQYIQTNVTDILKINSNSKLMTLTMSDADSVSYYTEKISSDTVLIAGSVVQNSDNEPVIGAAIVIKDINGNILASCASDLDGQFIIKLPSANYDISINAAMIGFKTYSAPLVLDGKPIIIKMEDEAVQLQEVIVKAERIRENENTITYNVGSFAQKQDKTIGDVLSRMPGIDVAKNGKLQYQGQDINKFYIEGNDISDGKYGVATNSISYEDIGAVEIIEYHQPVQVLQNLSFSDQAAINLKMKNKSKSAFLVHGIMADGISENLKGVLWQGDIATMMVSEKYQTINSFQGNNVGINLSNQLSDFTSGIQGETLDRYTSLSIPATPGLEQNRSYFNRSWAISSSHLLKMSNGGEFKVKIDYIKDRVSIGGTGSTTYFLESGDKKVFEDINSLSHNDVLTGKFTYEANKKTYFINNTLSTYLSRNNLTIDNTGTLPSTQSASMPEYTVSNNLKIIKRFSNNKLITFTSRNEWISLPEKITIDYDGNHYGQNTKQHSFYTDEKASLGFVFNNILLSLDAGITGYFRNFNTYQFGIDMMDFTGAETLTTDYTRVFASSKFEWSYKKLELTVNVPVNLYSYFFSGVMNNRTELFLSPSIEAKYHFTPRTSLILYVSSRRTPASLHDIHNASIITDYRSLSSGINDYYTSSGQSVSATFNYKNAPLGLFLILTGNYEWNHAKFGAAQNIINNFAFYSYKTIPYDSQNALAYVNISKTLDFMRGIIGLKGKYTRLNNSVLSQGSLTDYNNNSLLLSPFVNGNISSLLNWKFQFLWEKSILNISDLPRHSLNNYIYSGNITLTPCSLITWTTGGEFYRNQIEDKKYKNLFLLDSKLTFNISKKIEISASVTNIFNKKEYKYISFGSVSQYESSKVLRGREFLISIYLKK